MIWKIYGKYLPSGIIRGRSELAKSLIFKAGDAGFEPTTFGSGVQRKGFKILINILNYSRLSNFILLTILNYLGTFWILSGTYAARGR
jgi:hypothetical protein